MEHSLIVLNNIRQLYGYVETDDKKICGRSSGLLVKDTLTNQERDINIKVVKCCKWFKAHPWLNITNWESYQIQILFGKFIYCIFISLQPLAIVNIKIKKKTSYRTCKSTINRY